MATYAELNRCLARRSLPGAAGHHGEMKKLIERFISQHLKQQQQRPPLPGGRPLLAASSSGSLLALDRDRSSEDDRPDDLGPIVDTIMEHVGPASSSSHGGAQPAGGGAQQLLNLLVVLRILLRKAANRKGLPRKGVKAVVDLLGEPRPANVIKECFRVVLQMCYEHRNVMVFTELGGVSVLLRFLARLSDEELQANLLGALQSICYQAVGRHAVREGDGIPSIVRHLSSPNPKVHARAVGSIHNLTTDAKALSIVRQAGAIPSLIPLLSSPLQEVCSASAGALQNLSREPIARQLIEDGGALAPLADLLTSNDVHCQACAAGALYNLLVHKVEGQDDGLGKFKTLLSDAIVLGMVRSCLTDDDDDDDDDEEGAAGQPPPAHRV